MEDAQAAPEVTLNTILTGLGAASQTQAFRPVVKRLGSKYKASVESRPLLPETWTQADHDFLRASVNAEQEAALGYTYSQTDHSPG